MSRIAFGPVTRRPYMMIISFSISFWLFGAIAGAAEPSKKGIAFFESKIRPVLIKHCYQCHSADAKKIGGEFLLDTRGGMLEGGESGEVIVLGDPKESMLISALRHEDIEMPPKEKLPATVVADFVQWIKIGAPDPRDGQHQSLKRTIDLDEGRKFWAFQPIEKQVVPPKVKDSSWPRGAIDHFLLARLESAQLKPRSEADRQTLLRRVFFDLVGLPPSPEEMETFLVDKSPKALETIVDRLLASEQFGERWGKALARHCPLWRVQWQRSKCNFSARVAVS